jgi:phosphatidylglycerophosphatase A
MDALRKFIISGLGLGYLRPAPGTWGSLGACAVFAGLIAIGMTSLGAGLVLAAITLAASLACVKLGPFAEKTYGKKDPGTVSLDEWAGQAMTFIALPLGANWAEHGWVLAVGFVTFRLFDIIKPPPAKQSQVFPAGIGIVIDDLIAAVYANIASQLILRWAVGL